MVKEEDLTPEELEDVELHAWMIRERGWGYLMRLIWDAMAKEIADGN